MSQFKPSKKLSALLNEIEALYNYKPISKIALNKKQFEYLKENLNDKNLRESNIQEIKINSYSVYKI